MGERSSFAWSLVLHHQIGSQLGRTRQDPVLLGIYLKVANSRCADLFFRFSSGPWFSSKINDLAESVDWRGRKSVRMPRLENVRDIPP
jgi:hypothetical protein